MISVVLQSVAIKTIMLSVFMLTVTMRSAIILSVVAPLWDPYWRMIELVRYSLNFLRS